MKSNFLFLCVLSILFLSSPVQAGPELCVQVQINPRHDTIEQRGSLFILSRDREEVGFQYICTIQNRTSDPLTSIEITDHFPQEVEILSVSLHSLDQEKGDDRKPEICFGEGTFTCYIQDLEPGRKTLLVLELLFNLKNMELFDDAENAIHPLHQGPRYTVLGHYSQEVELESSYFFQYAPLPYLSVQISPTRCQWYIRKPGDYYALLSRATVQASHDVLVTFQDFAPLKGSDHVLCTYYSLTEGGPWLSPDTLRDMKLLLRTGNSIESFEIWQRLIVQGEAGGEYANRGVICFTLINSVDVLLD